MIGLDTNVLVRCIMQDDVKQSPKANRLIESLTAESPGFVPLVALIELVWALASCHDLTASGAGCDKTFTFDVAASKAAGMSLVS